MKVILELGLSGFYAAEPLVSTYRVYDQLSEGFHSQHRDLIMHVWEYLVFQTLDCMENLQVIFSVIYQPFVFQFGQL